MSPDLRGLDKVAARTRTVTPPRRPVAPVPPAAPTTQASTNDASAVTPSAPPSVAPRRRPSARPSPAIPRTAASEQLGVRLHGYQMRRLRRIVRLLDEEQGLHRPTQAEIIQVLIDALPEDAGDDLAELAGRVRAYRLRVVD